MMIIELTIGFLLFVVGYLLGRTNLLHGTVFQQSTENIANRFLTKSFGGKSNTPNKELPKININESKFVTDIKTDSFQKDFTNLGNKTISEDNISSSVSKLSQLKKNKE